MDITPSYVSIGKLFEQNILFEIPKYQRYYAWEDEQVDDFIEDIAALINQKEKDHFFGGIVCVEKIVDGSNRQQRELVDGQQRITTTMLLICALYYQYKAIEEMPIDGYIKELINCRKKKIERKYFFYEDEINRHPVTVRHLEISDADKECYEAIISGKDIPTKRESHKRLKKAYAKMNKFVSEKINGANDLSDKLNILADIEEVIDRSCTVIFIDSKTKKDAYALFQVLNDRGMGLTVGDLLKSKTLEIVAKEDSSINEDALLISATKLSHDKFSDLVQVLEKFMFRYKGVCNNKHQKLSEIFMKEALVIRSAPNTYRISSLTNQLRPLINESAGDDLFKEKLRSIKYVERGSNKLLKYLFATLNEYHKWYDEGATGNPKAEKGKIINFEDVSIEHIFSHSPQAGDIKPEELGDVNELRNLTILTLKENGDKAKNKPYATKRTVYVDSEYDINKKFEEYEEWNTGSMNSWMEYLLDLSCKVFVI